jgi:hypothetical protein
MVSIECEDVDQVEYAPHPSSPQQQIKLVDIEMEKRSLTTWQIQTLKRHILHLPTALALKLPQRYHYPIF